MASNNNSERKARRLDQLRNPSPVKDDSGEIFLRMHQNRFQNRLSELHSEADEKTPEDNSLNFELQATFVETPICEVYTETLPKRRKRSQISFLIGIVGTLLLLVILLTIFIPHPNNAVVYSEQVGGDQVTVDKWINSKGPLQSTIIPIKSRGPYSVIGNPSVKVDFINQVLSYYHSPAAGKGKALYDYGIQYGLDPVYPLAFFMHESMFGTTGVARVTLSLSNMRCVPEYRCLNENGGYAIFNTWEQSFEAWYKLIRNLYIAVWGRITVDQIIPKYAPNSDGNNEAEYIATLKHTVDTWRAGIIQV